MSYSYPFNILAASFTRTAPSTYPAISSLGAWSLKGAQYGVTNCNLFSSANAAGLYLSDGMSPMETSTNPYAQFNYDGSRVYWQLSDYFSGTNGASVPPPFNSGTTYTIGTPSKNGSYTYVVQVGGTGGTAPVGTTIGGTESSGGATWYNAGNSAYWNDCAYKVGIQFLNWAANAPTVNATSEWNQFTWGMAMHALRTGDVINENCSGSSTCSGLNATAVGLFSSLGKGNQLRGTYQVPIHGTIRALPYAIQSLLAQWVLTGVKPSELDRRIDLAIQYIDDLVHYNPRTSYCCVDPQLFDIGLLAEPMSQTYAVESYEGVTPDARIPIEMLKLADWTYTFYNLVGQYSFQYMPWMIPFNTTLSVGVNNELNNLIAPMYPWLFSMYGDGCTLPTSGVLCRDAGDSMFQHTLDSPQNNSMKSINQEYKWWVDYVGWRNGTMLPTDSWVLPAHNAYVGPYTDTVGPYPADGSSVFPAPIASGITSSGATVVWYTFEKSVSTTVKVATTANGVNAGRTFTCGASIFVGAPNKWANICAVTGLNPSTKYYFAVGGTDAEGNSALSQSGLVWNLQTIGASYNFTTTS